MKRSDISHSLIHLIRGNNSTAEPIFREVLSSGELMGSKDKIKSGDQCICFTETPVKILKKEGFKNYSDFGFIFDKPYIWGMGGRPVVYQSSNEFDYLDDSMKWKHCTFNPQEHSWVDWTWQREWRIKTRKLNITPDFVRLLVPDNFKGVLQSEHEQQDDWHTYQVSELLGLPYEYVRWAYSSPYPYLEE